MYNSRGALHGQAPCCGRSRYRIEFIRLCRSSVLGLPPHVYIITYCYLTTPQILHREG